MAETNAHQIAKWLIKFCHDHGNLITNLQLQKLVYYAQAWYLALFEKPLFDEEIQAWVHGPVQPSLYNKYCVYKWNPIAEDPEIISLPPHIEKHLQEIMEVYGQYDAYHLERLTHLEDPWKKARAGLPKDASSQAIISKEDMKIFYRAMANAQDQTQ